MKRQKKIVRSDTKTTLTLLADMCSRLGDEASTDLSQAAAAQTRKVPPKRPSNPTSSVEARKMSKKKISLCSFTRRTFTERKKIQSSRSLFYSLFFAGKKKYPTHIGKRARTSTEKVAADEAKLMFLPSHGLHVARRIRLCTFFFLKHNYVHLGSQASEVTRHKHQPLS